MNVEKQIEEVMQMIDDAICEAHEDELNAIRAKLRALLSSAQSGEQAAPQAVQATAPGLAANAPDLLPPMGIRNDRDMLNYLMGAFDREVHSCERCGHGEDTKDMDSASFLREYMAAAPAHPAEGVPNVRAKFEAWVETDYPIRRGFGKENNYDFVEVRRMWSAWQAALAATQPAAQGLHSQSEWEEMHTLPTCDDLIWLYCQDTNTIDGPIAPDPSLEQYGWTHWAYANAPSTAGIDAAQAKQGGA